MGANESMCDYYVSDTQSLPSRIARDIYDLYHKTYSKAGEKLWFGTADDIQKHYPCGVVYACSSNGSVRCGVLFQIRNTSHANEKTIKLSLIIHDGERESIDELFRQLLPKMLGKPGVYIEASCAVSRLHRKYNAPQITEREQIKAMLQLPGDQGIVLNPIHDPEGKFSQRYVHLYWSTEKHDYGALLHNNAETMFGTFGTVHTTGSCDDVNKILNIGRFVSQF
jgi:hypothetical protein